MRLNEQEYYQFMRVFKSLLYYIVIRENRKESTLSFEKFKDIKLSDLYEVRNRIYDRPEYLQEFITDNMFSLSEDDLAVVSEFKGFLKGTFWITKYEKTYTVFYCKNKAYAVLALSDSFQSFFGTNIPQIVETIILPFKGRIIYDSIMSPYRIAIGATMKKSILAEVMDEIKKNGIIKSLS